jgi:hypothetical protein
MLEWIIYYREDSKEIDINNDLIPKIYTIVRETHQPATVVFLIKAFLLDSRSLTRELVAYKNLRRYGEINA